MAAHLLLMFPLRYIYLVHTPKLGFVIVVPGRKREQGCFRVSSNGARGRSEGAEKSNGAQQGNKDPTPYA